MPSKQHEQKIEEIAREIQSRSLNWKIKKNSTCHIISLLKISTKR